MFNEFFARKISNGILLPASWTYLGVSSLLLYFFPHSVTAFLLFLSSLFVLYKMPLSSRVKITLAGIILGLVLPLAGMKNAYYLEVATQVGIYAALAIGLNIVVGFAGLLDLGYVAFYAAGAYLYGIFATSQANNFIPVDWVQFPLSGEWFWLFIPFSMLLAAIVGVILGFPVLRLRGDYLAIVTLGFGEIIRIIFNNLDKPVNITNGPKGLTPIQPPALFGHTLNQPIHYYLLVLAIIVLTIIAARRLEKSRIGRAWAAIREDEMAARAMGIHLVKMKLLAFATGASFAGVMGVIFASKQTFIDPSSFSFMESIGILAMVILGGMGNVAGVVLGAAVVVVLQLHLLKEFSDFLRQLSTMGIINIPSQLDPTKYERLIFGLILIIATIFRPQGLLPGVRPALAKITKKKGKGDKLADTEGEQPEKVLWRDSCG